MALAAPAAPVVAPAEPLIVEDASLDRFLIPHKAIFHVVDSFGRCIGEIHPRCYGEKYTACALCLHKEEHKERCSRTRSWKPGQKPMQGVERVLICWLMDASRYSSTHAHMNCDRL